MNILFVCSKNQWRSPTAEAIFKNQGFHQVRSAGTSSSARIKISSNLINWADLVFVMEKEHKNRMQENFRKELHGKEIIVLEISDNYQYMDEELILELEHKVSPYL